WATRLSRMDAATPENQLLLSELVESDQTDAAFEILRDNWKRITDENGVKEMILDAFTAAAHPRVLDILHLGATDPALPVQNVALYRVQLYAFQNFTEDYSAYLEWRKQFAGKPIPEVLRENCRAYIARFDKAEEVERQTLAQQFTIIYFAPTVKLSRARRQAALDVGILDMLAKHITPTDASPSALELVSALDPDEDFLRRVIAPLLDKNVPNATRFAAMNVFRRPGNRWACDRLLEMLKEEYPGPASGALLNALRLISDPHALPTLIGMLEADDTPDGMQLLGGTLGQMVAIGNGASHNGAWWRNWWEKNKLRFPEDVRALTIPKLKLKLKAVAVGAGAVTAIQVESRRIANDPQRTYWLLRPQKASARGVPPDGRAVPDSAPGLLVVLAGGDGNGANAVAFWQEVAQKALKGNYLVALPVAPKWGANPPIVWVTRGSRKQVKEARFTTESFVADIVKDVAATQAVAPDRVYLHGAADSGPAAYACSLEETTPFHGFYILASAFKSAQLPSLAHAKGRRYLIQHSKEDKVSPFWMAAAAQKLLSQQGAVVRLLPYRGNHGYDF